MVLRRMPFSPPGDGQSAVFSGLSMHLKYFLSVAHAFQSNVVRY